jgi:hypothetical protein
MRSTQLPGVVLQVLQTVFLVTEGLLFLELAGLVVEVLGEMQGLHMGRGTGGVLQR